MPADHRAAQDTVSNATQSVNGGRLTTGQFPTQSPLKDGKELTMEEIILESNEIDLEQL
jgi:hypothetical protein